MKMEIKKVPRVIKNVDGDAFCIDDCICTYAHYRGVDSEPLYLGALRAPCKMLNGEMVGSGSAFHDDVMEDVGFHVEFIEWDNKDELLEGIKTQIAKGNVVAIGLEGYHCPWDWRYQEIYIEGDGHEFFVVDINEEKEEFICVDPYYEVEEATLPYSCCEQGCLAAKVYNYEEKACAFSASELIRKIDLEINNWESTSQELIEIGNNMKKHIEASVANLDMDEDFSSTYTTANNNVIYGLLEVIANNRIRFSWFLKYLEKREIIHSNDIAEGFVDIAKMWITISKMLLKNIYRGKTDVEIYQEKILEVCTYEKQMLEKLHLEIHSDHKQNISKISHENTSKEYSIYDIQEYNNKGIQDNSSVTANFNGFGENFIWDTFPKEQPFFYQDIPFRIQISQSEGDNIACQKQKLNVPLKKYSKVCFLACSDWGECKDLFQLMYSDETIDNNLLEISEWVPNRRTKQENVCIIAQKTIKDIKDEFEKCYIYYYELNCNPDKELSCIVLPNCENIHVFAVTLVE